MYFASKGVARRGRQVSGGFLFLFFAARRATTQCKDYLHCYREIYLFFSSSIQINCQRCSHSQILWLCICKEMLGVANFYPGSSLLLVAQLCSVWPCRLIIYLPWLDPAALLRCANVVRPLLSVIVCVFISCEMQRYGRWSNTSTL